MVLAGGTDFKGVMERMGHTHFNTTQTHQHTPTRIRRTWTRSAASPTGASKSFRP
jgi:hypothetical protein